MIVLLVPGLLAACADDAPPPGAVPLPPPPRGVAWFTSPDGQTWQRQPGTAHDGLQSLGLAVRPDGELWLTGMNFRGKAGWLERLTGPPVHGARFDGRTWTATTWSVDDPDTVNFIDPQWFGDELWYVARPGTTGDPALDGGSNRVRSTPPARDVLALATVTDPSPVRFRGALHLFVTTGAARVEHWGGTPLTPVRQWGEVTVPFPLVVADELWLVAQRVAAPRVPMLARSADGVTWSPFAPLLPPGTIGSCTSPVLGPNPAGGYVLACVEEAQP